MSQNREEDVVDSLLTTIDLASQRMLQLSEMMTAVKKMTVTVSVTAQKSKDELQTHFSDLKRQINQVLDKRLSSLLSEVSTLESDSTLQLKLFTDEITQSLDETKSLMDQGKSYLKNDPDARTDDIIKFKKTADRKLVERLPELVPDDPVTKITVDLPSTVLPSILSELRQHGDVIGRVPVQITEIDQRPGGLYVVWAETFCQDEERDMAEFRLQMCGQHQSEFIDIYTGQQSQYQIRGLRPGDRYSFRIAGRYDTNDKWSPFSDVQSATVQLRHHEWSTDTADYAVTDDNTVATKMSVTTSASTIYSAHSSYICGHQMALRVLEAGSSDSSAVIGLCMDRSGDSLGRQGALCISMEGKVLVNGSEMVTKLPALSQGICLSISSEVLSASKVRVTLEVEERVVTVDWKLSEDQFPLPGLEVAPKPQLYFALSCEQSGLSVKVE